MHLGYSWLVCLAPQQPRAASRLEAADGLPVAWRYRGLALELPGQRAGSYRSSGTGCRRVYTSWRLQIGAGLQAQDPSLQVAKHSSVAPCA